MTRQFLALALITAAACAGRDRPASAPRAPATTPESAATAAAPRAAATAGDPTDRLRADLAATFDNPSVRALWAAKVLSLDTGEVLFERHAHTLVMPASNMKVVTLAVAAETLGWDARLSTRIEADGPTDGGTLRGNLIVTGSGDPSIVDRTDTPRVFDAWAQKLAALGLTRIDGHIVGDDDAFEDQMLGSGWSWDDLAFSSAAGYGALQYNENVARVVIAPGAAPGEPARASLEPGSSDLILDAIVTTGQPDSTPEVTVRRRPFDRRLVVRGSVPKTGRDYTRVVAVDNPTRYFVSALRAALVQRGIDVRGEAIDIDDLQPRPTAPRTLLFVHDSPPLSDIGVRFMKVSQNLIGETLMTRLGLHSGQGPAKAAAQARSLYESVLVSWGIPIDELIIADGSGLSRYNFLTANALVTVLRRMASDVRHAVPFEATLPVMGKDGTLASRMRGTAAEGRVRAKTGSLSNVRALCGYLTTAGGERLTFAIIANNFKAPTQVVDAVTERAIEMLLSSDRKRKEEGGNRK